MFREIPEFNRFVETLFSLPYYCQHHVYLSCLFFKNRIQLCDLIQIGLPQNIVKQMGQATHVVNLTLKNLNQP